MAESEFYLISLGKTKEGEPSQRVYIEVNGDKSTVIFCEPDSDISYPKSKIEKISEEEVEKALRKDLDYHPA